jgi:hypothetical protein
MELLDCKFIGIVVGSRYNKRTKVKENMLMLRDNDFFILMYIFKK